MKAMRSSLVRLEEIANRGGRDEVIEASREIRIMWFDIVRAKYGGF